MARIKPFKAVRPISDKVHLVASRSYVSYSKEKLKEKLDTNPFTFIHIINPDYDSEDRAKGGSAEMFIKVKSKYQQFLTDNILLKDEEDSFYVYQQKTTDHSYTGLITGVSVKDYLDKKIKIHEATIARRESLFSAYLDAVDFNAEPVLFSYPSDKKIDDIINQIKSENATYNFTTADSVTHTLWRVSNSDEMSALKNSFEKVQSFYIADGHHRSASSVNLSLNRNNPKALANSNWFMAMLTSEDEMKIFGYHRLLTNVSKSEADSIVNRISQNFQLEPIKDNFFSPESGSVHMYYFGTGWTKFNLKSVSSDSAKDAIDAEKLSNQVFSPLAEIHDLKDDKRIKFVHGKTDLKELLNKIDDGNEILFLLAPVTFEQLKNVADSGEYMPPKSTYIEPKLRSGLTIFDISDE